MARTIFMSGAGWHGGGEVGEVEVEVEEVEGAGEDVGDGRGSDFM